MRADYVWDEQGIVLSNSVGLVAEQKTIEKRVSCPFAQLPRRFLSVVYASYSHSYHCRAIYEIACRINVVHAADPRQSL